MSRRKNIYENLNDDNEREVDSNSKKSIGVGRIAQGEYNFLNVIFRLWLWLFRRGDTYWKTLSMTSADIQMYIAYM